MIPLVIWFEIKSFVMNETLKSEIVVKSNKVSIASSVLI